MTGVTTDHERDHDPGNNFVRQLKQFVRALSYDFFCAFIPDGMIDKGCRNYAKTKY